MLEVIILAAGEGKRMHSSRPKVLQPIGGRPMVDHLLDSVACLQPECVHVVVGAGTERVTDALAGRGCHFVEQIRRLGTGHAAAQALPGIDPAARVLILPGDMPLVRPQTLADLVAVKAELAVLSFRAVDPTGYGRILRDGQGRVRAIREEKDASDEERVVDEVNSGVLCCKAGDLADWLDQISADNAQGEYYLTDCIGIAADAGRGVEALVAGDAGELLGANDRVQLAMLERVFQRRAREELMAAGATLTDPDSVQIRGRIRVGQDVIVDSNVILEGDISLGDNVMIGPGCVLSHCDLAAGTRLKPYSVLESVRTSGACDIGPFARLRPGTELAEGVKIGNFVETKNARFGAGAKASHLSYVGDAEIGEAANIGAGTITCNYDGVNKHRTVIGPEAFIGSNTSLVAPIKVGAGATVGAGSVLTQNAPEGQLTLARARQHTVENWKRPSKKSDAT